MKRPSFQFYPADWKSNMKLRICSEQAKGAWIEILCILHDCEEYGVFRRKLSELIRASGVSKSSVKELVEKGVLKGSDDTPEEFVYTPRSGRKNGEPVTLIRSESGPCWYSTRMVRDEYVRKNKAAQGQFSSDNQPEKSSSNHSPMPPIGEEYGDVKSDGSTSSSTSTSSLNTLKEKINKKEKPVAIAPDIEKYLLSLGVSSEAISRWATHRKKNKSEVTERVVRSFKEQAELAGISLEDAICESIDNGWKGFKAAWVKDSVVSTKGKFPPCPHQEIIKIFVEELPECPEPSVLDATRKRLIEQRWSSLFVPELNGTVRASSVESGLEFMRKFFRYVKNDTRILKNYNVSFAWLMKEEIFISVKEGNFYEEKSNHA